MPLNLPPSLQLFKPKDLDAQRFLPPIERSVTQILSFLRSSFEDATNAGLRILKPVLLKSLTVDDLIADKSVTSNGSLTSNGTFINYGPLNQFRPANFFQGINTPGGFLCAIDMGYHWSNPATASTRYRTVLLTQNAQNTANYFQFPTLFQPPFAGSIVGIHTWSQGSAGGNVFVQVFKNTTAITGTPIIDVLLGSAATNVGNSVTYTRGQFPFAAMDYFPVSVAFNTGGNQAVQVRLYVEFTA